MMNQINVDENKISEVVELLKLGKFHQALYELKELKKKYNHFIIEWYLGHAYFKLHSYIAAINHVKKSIELKSKDSLNLNFLGEVYLEINEHDKAIKLFEEVLNLEKNNKNAMLNLAKAYLNLGKIDKSEKYFNILLQNDPLNFGYYYSLIGINKNYLTKLLIEEIKKNENKLNNNNLIYSKLIIAKQAEIDKDYSAEIDNLMNAHKIYAEIRKRALKQQYNYYTNLLPRFLSKIGKIKVNIKDNISPIFIMGLPRSGTTLVEKIIVSGKKNIEMGGETDVFDKVFYSEKIIKNYDNENLLTDFSFDEKNIVYLKNKIIEQYNQQNLYKNNLIFTDKSISNFLYVELIYKLFPNCKIIYCYRNPLANLIGVLRSFLPNIFWSHSLDNILSMFDLYFSKLEELKKNKLIDLKVIKIEDLTNDPESISKDLYNYLNLEWSVSCLQNTDNNMVVKTASNLQVRNKIIKHDLKYTSNYLKILKKFGCNYKWLS